ncbi:MAG: hypothetical protein HC888_12570, partial [Candidatus Competibacteraceae bacterium]|nr:hypothetical protein [Candidatus Competibacteraceae bacterium]
MSRVGGRIPVSRAPDSLEAFFPNLGTADHVSKVLAQAADAGLFAMAVDPGADATGAAGDDDARGLPQPAAQAGHGVVAKHA